MAARLYIGNLSYSTTDEGLNTAFAEHGEVVSASVVMDRDTGRSRGFGFVEMASDEGADAAIEGLNGVEIDGRELRVEKAKPRPESSGDSW